MNLLGNIVRDALHTVPDDILTKKSPVKEVDTLVMISEALRAPPEV